MPIFNMIKHPNGTKCVDYGVKLVLLSAVISSYFGF